MDLKCLLKSATSIFFNKDQEERKEKDKRDKRKVEALIMALQGVDFRAAKVGGQKQKSGASFHYGKDGHFKGMPPVQAEVTTEALPHLQRRSLEE